MKKIRPGWERVKPAIVRMQGRGHDGQMVRGKMGYSEMKTTMRSEAFGGLRSGMEKRD